MSRPFRTVCVVSLAALLLALSYAPVVARDAAAALTSDELSKLERGELVVRASSERRGELRLIGGTSFQVVSAPPEVVWQALLDTQYYRRMLPELQSAQLIRETAKGRITQRIVSMTHGRGPAVASYTLSMQIDPAKRDIAFKLDETRAHDIRAAWGFYTVRPHGQGRTLLIFGVLADPGDGLFKTVLRPAVQDWALRVPWMVKRFVEGSGRYIYKAKPATPSVLSRAR
jgi:carbon monoxide dehydrogenase subunit G